MSNKSYRIHDQELSFEEDQAFIDRYTRGMCETRSRYVEILPYVPSDAYVLDYGCGWGVFSQMLFEHGCTVDGIDIDPDSIAIAKDVIQGKDRLTFSLKDIRDIADEVYEVVACGYLY